MIRILVVDDHELVRIGLRHILADYPALKIVGEAGDGETAIRLNRQVKPDVALLDIHMPGLSGFEVTTRLRQMNPDLGIIILTIHEAAPFPGRLLAAGASAYLTKGCPATELVQAIRTPTYWRQRGATNRIGHASGNRCFTIRRSFSP
jgi:two-component system invasion response regulator UvrY